MDESNVPSVVLVGRIASSIDVSVQDSRAIPPGSAIDECSVPSVVFAGRMLFSIDASVDDSGAIPPGSGNE
jgi:hypothetical protein